MPHWKRNLIVLCGAQFLTLTGFSAYMPFIPYYVQELGVESNALVVAWLAAYNTGGAIAMMVSAPIWGSLADRVGRKPMVVRATLAGAVFALGLSLTQTPLQLVVVRILQGIFCGTVSAAITLVATETPDEYLGRGLGAMQAAQYVAFALGPLVGGVAADGLGYRAVFLISGVMMLVAAVAIAGLAREGSLSLARRRHGLPRLRLGREAQHPGSAHDQGRGRVRRGCAEPGSVVVYPSLEPGQPPAGHVGRSGGCRLVGHFVGGGSGHRPSG